MAIVIKSNNDESISDYIVSSGTIPLTCNRNRNLSPIIGEFKMAVSENCPEALRAVGVSIDIYTRSSAYLPDVYPAFTGEITESLRVWNNRTYLLTIKDKLYKLDEKMVTYDNLQELIEAGAGSIRYWVEETDKPFNSVQVSFLIEKMFEDVGLNFEWEGVVFGSGFTWRNIDTVDGNAIQIRHLRVDVGMLYHINQHFCQRQIQQIKYNSNRISYWDFISAFLTTGFFPTRGAYLYLSQTGVDKEYRIGYLPSTSSVGGVYSLVEGDIVSENKGWTVSHDFDDNRFHYRGIETPPFGFTEDEIPLNREEDFSEGEGAKSLRVYDSLVFLYHKYWETGNRIIWDALDDGGAYANGECVNAETMSLYQQRAKDSDWTIKKRQQKITERKGDMRTVNLNVKDQTLETLQEG